MISYFYILQKGLCLTLAAWIITGICSLTLGLCLGIASCRFLATQNSEYGIRFYTFIAKGIPAYVQILIAYFVVPALFNIQIPAFIAACGALAFCSSGYVTEIVRSGINAIPQDQWLACRILGYPLFAQLKRVILPQVFKNSAPALFGEMEQLLKSTSLLATIGITELTRTGMNIISRELNPIPVYTTIACLYLMCAALLHGIMIIIERKTRYGQRY